MAVLPTGYVVGTRGVYTTPTESIGGVAIGVSDATAVAGSNGFTRTMPVMSILASTTLADRRTVAKEQSGTAHTYSAQTAKGSGTFAYDPNEYLIRGYSTTINGVANTALLFNGNEQYRQRTHNKLKSWGYKYSTAFRAGYFSFTGVANQRTNWTTPPSALNDTFRSTTDNSVDATDEAQFVTFRSVPGELVYMDGGRNPFTDEYKAVTG